MKEYTAYREFRNPPSELMKEIRRITNLYYLPFKENKMYIELAKDDIRLRETEEIVKIMENKMSETLQEYKAGCRESKIKELIQGDTFDILLDRIANFIDREQTASFRNIMIDFIVENNLFDEEELV